MTVLPYPTSKQDPRETVKQWNAWLDEMFGVATSQYQKSLEPVEALADLSREAPR